MNRRKLTAGNATLLAILIATLCVSGCSDDSGVGGNDNTNGNSLLHCGNGELEGIEECDDGDDNSDLVPDACRTDCTLPRCGDGVTDAGDACDDGAQNADHVPDACRTDCTEPQCGDGVVDVQGGEDCDDGNTDADDGCSDLCRTEYCGNGFVDPDEDCDDGNLIAGDGCGPTCQGEGCGNGFMDPGEACDDGNLTLGDGCSDQCQQEYCGNGVIDPGELCDDGNQIFGDGCSPDCVSAESCGNGYLDWATGETCDDGGLRSGDGCASDCAVESPDWHPEAGSATPEAPVYCTTMAYHAGLRRTVLFGGSSDCDETWEYDGTTWQQVFPPSAPSTRLGAVMTYDARRERIVLFGGDIYDNTFVNETWEYDGDTWTRIFTANAPPARGHQAMAYDAARGKVVIFGGECAPKTSCTLGDTWEYDGTDWQQITTAVSPVDRKFASMAYDPVRQRIVLHGGMRRTWTIETLDDTWLYNGSTWQQATPAHVPPARSRHSLTFDAARGQIVMVGGTTAEETWAWDGTDWTQLFPATGPGSRSAHGAAYDIRRDRTVIFGGGDTATWELERTAWQLGATAPRPEAREIFAMAYDSNRHRTVLFGGSALSGLSDETWEHDGRRWFPASPVVSPPARTGHAMTYDASRLLIVMAGGGSQPGMMDTWEYDGNTWSQVPTANGPANGSYHALAFDAARGQTVLLTGDETWVYDGVDWTHLPGAGAPSGTNRTHHAMAYDAARAQLVLFGGRSGPAGDTLHNDTWVFDGSTWSQLTTPGSPSARYAHTTTYDPVRQTVLIHGGDDHAPDNFVQLLQDTWEFDGASWTQIVTSQIPGARSNHGMVYDRLRGRAMIFGGQPGFFVLDDTWHLIYGEPWNQQDCRWGAGDDDGDGLIGCADPDCAEECRACGDGICDVWETRGLCPGDCGARGPVCGDGLCDAVESCVTCRSDCPSCLTEVDCYDGGDDDGDGQVDCADSDCVGCAGAACTSGADCHSGHCAGTTCAAPLPHCQALLAAAPTTPDGDYVLDPDGPGGTAPYRTRCDMTTDGGGWTLVLVSSDDGRPSFTWSRRALLTILTATVGYAGAWNWAFKSPALHSVNFSDLLFTHAPSGIWAAYHGVGNASLDVGTFMATRPYPNCSLATGHPMGAGTLTATGLLCDTNLYFHNGDQDGGSPGANCTNTNRTYYNGSYGPVWNSASNTTCHFNDSAFSGVGPDSYTPADQSNGVGFGASLGLNTGLPQAGENYLQMYVR